VHGVSDNITLLACTNKLQKYWPEIGLIMKPVLIVFYGFHLKKPLLEVS